MRAFDAELIRLYRAGELLPEPLHRERLALLTTTGARSGEPRTAPMMFIPRAGWVLVVASANGAPSDPHWFRNLRADPAVHLELPQEEYDAVARVVEGEERAALWEELIASYPFFVEHQERADREIPLVELTRA